MVWFKKSPSGQRIDCSNSVEIMQGQIEELKSRLSQEERFSRHCNRLNMAYRREVALLNRAIRKRNNKIKRLVERIKEQSDAP